MAVSVPYSKLVPGFRYRKSNYLSEYEGWNATLSEVNITGSGVNKRPNWKKLPMPQRNSPLPYTKSWDLCNHALRIRLHDEDGKDGLGNWRHNYSYEQEYIQYHAQSGRFAFVASDALYKAKARLFDQLKGEGTNIANMFAERKQTFSAISNTATRIAYTIRDLKRGNITSAIRRMAGDPKTAKKLRGKDIADQWIALQYGWKPMLSDIYGLVNGLHVRETAQRPKIFRASASSEYSAQSANTWVNAKGAQEPWGMRATKVSCKYTVQAFPNAALASPSALGLTNPLVPLWEILPWSFIVDWFLPVGNYLDQLSADHGWTFHNGCLSVLETNTENASKYARYSWQGPGEAGIWRYVNDYSIVGNWKHVAFSRSLLTGFPTASLPRFKNPISTGHVLNSIALLVQQFAKK
jgi:hypothetical protein